MLSMLLSCSYQVLGLVSQDAPTLRALVKGSRAYVSPKIFIGLDGQSGRGFYAKEDIAGNEVLACVPRRSTIVYDTIFSEIPPTLGTVLKKIASIDVQHNLIHALFLASQRYNKSSAFAFYLDHLPDRTQHAVHLDELLIAALGSESEKFARVNAIREHFNSSAEFVSRVWPTLYGDFDGEEGLRWAMAIVSSRAFLVDLRQAPGTVRNATDERKERALIPLLDLFNHHQDAAVKVFYESTNDSLCLKTLSSWVSGQQVFSNYGSLTEVELFAQHGIEL